MAPTLGLLGTLDGSGQRLFGWGPPTGHPDDAEYWLASNMMRMRWALLLGLADDAWKAGSSGVAQELALGAPTAQVALFVAHRELLGVDPPAKVSAAILGGLGLQPAASFESRKDALPLARRMLAYCAMTPAFQTR